MSELKKQIGELLYDGIGEYRIINGVKIYQIKETTPRDKETNALINEFRASGMSISDFVDFKQKEYERIFNLDKDLIPDIDTTTYNN